MTEDYDAIIVSADYGSLITGAILSRNGLKTLVVDVTEQIGGHLGCVLYKGYSLDWGPRDAKDFEDNFVVMSKRAQYGKKAAEAAGAEIAWVGPIDPPAEIHRRDVGKVVRWTGGQEAQVRFATEALDLSADQATEFFSILEQITAEDPQKWKNVTMKEWLDTLENKAFHEAFLRIAMLHVAMPLEESSVGKWIEMLRDPQEIYKIDDPDVGGLQGFVESYAKVIRNNGGEIKLGLQTEEILLEENKVAGIVVRDKKNIVQVFHAPVVVFGEPIWEVFKVLDESIFPRAVVENAWKLKSECSRGDMMCKNIGLARVPTIRATGQPDQYTGWSQFLDVISGWMIPTLTSKKQAPPGKHLLNITAGSLKRWSFKEGKARVDEVHEYLRRYYLDLDEITEWKTYNWPKMWGTSHMFTTTTRSPLQIDGIMGLYFVGNTVEVAGLYQDVGSNSALKVSQLILNQKVL